MSSSSAATASAPAIPAFSLHNGVNIPSVAFGCSFGNWTGGESFQGLLPEQSWAAISVALHSGFRHFDGAHLYSTERHLGNSLGPYFANGSLKRSDVFVTTKVFHPRPGPGLYMSHRRTWNARDFPAEQIRKKVLDDFDKSLEDLGFGYADLLLIHWPGAFDEKDFKFAREHRLRVWRVLEELYKKKVVRAIGVSNFTRRHLEELIADGIEVLPMVNQVELHPYCQDHALVKFCAEKKIIVEAYAPLASGCFNLLQDSVLLEISKQVGRSVGQVILRWHHQHGIVTLPRSSNAQRAKDNLAIFDFQLTAEQMNKIDALHTDGQKARRTCADPNTIA